MLLKVVALQRKCSEARPRIAVGQKEPARMFSYLNLEQKAFWWFLARCNSNVVTANIVKPKAVWCGLWLLRFAWRSRVTLKVELERTMPNSWDILGCLHSGTYLHQNWFVVPNLIILYLHVTILISCLFALAISVRARVGSSARTRDSPATSRPTTKQPARTPHTPTRTLLQHMMHHCQYYFTNFEHFWDL